jgi:hypothetical protein
MKKIKYLFVFILSTINILLFGQDGRFYFIKDKDTINSNQINVTVMLEMSNKTTILFKDHNKLLYPATINCDSINSILILYNKDTLSFFNFKELVKNSNLPPIVLNAQRPLYSSLFKDRRNMYFTVDTYPFDNEERTEVAKLKDKKNYKNKTVVELYYQGIEMKIK